jgi:hypothetical protein
MKSNRTVNSHQSKVKPSGIHLAPGFLTREVLTAPQAIGLDRTKEYLKQTHNDCDCLKDRDLLKRNQHGQWDLLPVQRQLRFSKSKSLCGMPSSHLPQGASVSSVKGKSATFGGLNFCKSPLCVICGPKIARKRAEQIETVLNSLEKYDLQAFFITYTVQTIKDADLQVKTLNDGYNTAMTGFKTWFKRQHGKEALKDLLMTFRHVDYTFKLDGFHNHLHTLLILPKGIKRGFLARKLIPSFVKKVHKMGLRASMGAQDIRVAKTVEVSSYLTKMFNGYEITSAMSKTITKTKKSLSYPELLKACLDEGKDGKWFKIYERFMRAMNGKRIFQASRNVKDFIAKIEADAQNGEIEDFEAEPVKDEEIVVLSLGTPLYRLIEAHKAQSKVLKAVETYWEEDQKPYLVLEALSKEASDLRLAMDLNYNEQMIVLEPAFKMFLEVLKFDARFKTPNGRT